MKNCKYISLMKILLFIVLVVLPQSVIAAPALQDKPLAYGRSVVAYRLTLALVYGTSELPSYNSSLMLKLTNLTHNILVYSWVPVLDTNYASFHVEYKGPTDNPNLDSGWMPLKPNAKPVSKPVSRNSDPVVSMISNRQRICVPPGEDAGQSFVPDFPMTKLGFYRVTAVTTIPHASEFHDTVSESTLVKNFTLVASSKPLVIRRTTAGFAEVPAAASKAVSAH